MFNTTKKTMKSILDLRLKDLQQKLANAKTEDEKIIYAEAIEHCIHDSQRALLSARKRKIFRIVLWVFIIIILGLLWDLLSLHRETGIMVEDSQSIGKAVTDNSTQ